MPGASQQAALYETYGRKDLIFERGEGAWLFTADGDRYLDFAAGIAVNSLGHAHPQLIAALNRQAQNVWHVSNLFRIAQQEEFAARLCELSFADKVFVTNSGTESIECAIKSARRYHYMQGAPERYRIVTFAGAFHGRTLAAIAAAGNDKYLQGFGPPLDGFDQITAGDTDALERAVGPHTAGILIEPVQGEGGIRVIEPAFLRTLRRICDETGCLLILDEVQCGIGRTGKLFAHEHAGITPDLMAIAKGVGGGFPLGACLATESVAAAMTIGSHGTTFGGNPLACAVGNAVLGIVGEPAFLDTVARTGLRFKQRLAEIADTHSALVEEVRGLGLMIGLKTRVPANDVIAALLAQKLLCVSAADNVIRLLPPLNIDDTIIDLACKRLHGALVEL